MTTLTEAARAALRVCDAALAQCQPCAEPDCRAVQSDYIQTARESVRAALAASEVQAEPVGHVRIDSGEVHIVPKERDAEFSALRDGQSVYAHPPAPEQPAQGVVDGKQYAKRDHIAQGEHFIRHLSAMTGEGLHAKSAIAAELAHRDIEIQRLIAAIASAPRVPQWQPIDTAPKGIEQVLLRVPTRWGKPAGHLVAHGYWSRDIWLIFNADGAVQRVDPTHWMPLPAAPQPEGGQS